MRYADNHLHMPVPRASSGPFKQSTFITTSVISLILLSLTPVADLTWKAEAADPIHQYKFHHYPDLTYDLHQWQDEYPHLMELHTLGTSYLGREIWNVHLTNFNENRDRALPKIYLDGGHHGNEYCGSEITILMIQYLLENYGTDPDATHVLDNAHVYVTPMVNPDGIDMNTRFNSRQVDLNRNYPYMWRSTSSPWGSSGSAPASEVEVASNVAFMERHEFDLIITAHTGIVCLIYPWGYTRDPSPDHNYFKKVGEEVEERWDIPTGQSSVYLYTAHGTGKDYGYAGNFAPTWTFEVDDEQFVPVSGEAISRRLQPIFECYLFLMNEAISGKWWPDPEVSDVDIVFSEGKKFRAVFTVTNSGYIDIVNGTATLTVGDRVLTSPFSVGQFNRTEVIFNVTEDLTGKYDLQLRLDYTKLTLNTSRPLTYEYPAGVVVMDDDGWLGYVESWGMTIVALLVVLQITITLRRRGRNRDAT